MQGEVAEDSPLVSLSIGIHNTNLHGVACILKSELQANLTISSIKIGLSLSHTINHRTLYTRNENFVFACIKIGRVVTCTMEACHTKFVCSLRES